MEIQDIQYILGANPEVEEEEELKEDTAIIKYLDLLLNYFGN